MKPSQNLEQKPITTKDENYNLHQKTKKQADNDDKSWNYLRSTSSQYS